MFDLNRRNYNLVYQSLLGTGGCFILTFAQTKFPTVEFVSEIIVVIEQNLIRSISVF